MFIFYFMQQMCIFQLIVYFFISMLIIDKIPILKTSPFFDIIVISIMILWVINIYLKHKRTIDNFFKAIYLLFYPIIFIFEWSIVLFYILFGLLKNKNKDEVELSYLKYKNNKNRKIKKENND